MSSSLICIGSAAERSLPVVFTALSCGAALPLSLLRVFCLSENQNPDEKAADLASDLSACHRLMQKTEGASLFPSSFSLGFCSPVFRPLHELAEDPDTALLISALRGKGQPLSCKTDRDAVEWCFADLLSHPEDPSVLPFLSWLEEIDGSSEPGMLTHITLLADLTDPFSSGIALVLLPFLREKFGASPVFLSVIALADSGSSSYESCFPALSAWLQAMEDRRFLRSSDAETAFGGDALWLLSLPSSLVPASITETNESVQLTALAAARVLGSLGNSVEPLPYGFHTNETDGFLSVASLRNQADSFASFLRASVWLLTDLIPSLRSWMSRPTRLRSLAPNSRNALFRQLFPVSSGDVFSSDLDLAESTLKALISNILSFLKSVPFSLRASSETESAWQQAVNACGRYITVASEYDTSAAEARESGLDSVRPVHRVSMADTEEEQLASRLQKMKLQLENEEKLRAEALAALGGYRSFQVRLDCLSRCRSALKEARLKSESLSGQIDNLAVLKQKRRIRLLESAVTRCESELDPDKVASFISISPKGQAVVSDPYTGGILNAEACRFLEKWLDLPGDEPAAKVPSLFPGFQDEDPKLRLKTLFTLCRNAAPSDPLSYLFSQAFTVCCGESSSLRFPETGVLPPVQLLPDLCVDTPLQRIRDILQRIPGHSDHNADLSEQRGLLAMLLLRQYRRRQHAEASLSCSCCTAGSSTVLRYWLGCCRSEKVYIFSLETGENSFPFALILPGLAFIPAKRLSAQNTLIPSFAVWFDAEKESFSDPCRFLGEGDRMLLLELLSSYTEALPQDSLSAFLADFIRDLRAEPESVSTDRNLKTRLKAACGLPFLPAYESSISRVTCFYEHFLPADPFGSCLTGKEDFPASACADIPEEILYLYRGVPFARENTHLLLDSPHAAGEDYTLARLKDECSILSESSDDFRDALLLHLKELLDRYPNALQENRDTALSVLNDAGESLEHREPVFTWPWDTKSPSMLSVLRESLGSGILDTVLTPFSDCLCVFPARGMDVIGDSLLSSMCTVFPPEGNGAEESGISPDAVLPPLSPEFGRILSTLPEGRTLLKPGLLHFERFRKEDDSSDSFRVILTLNGVFPVHFVRIYSPEETLHLYAHDIPTLALWPSVPFRPEDWHAYYVYAHMKPVYSVSVLSGSGEYTNLQLTSENRYASEFASFPVCFSFSCEGKTIGLIPNVLPSPLLEPADPVDICVDFGSSGTSVVFSSGRRRRPMHGPVMIRTLLNNPSASQSLLRREFLPAVPVSALLPTVSRLFRNVPGTSPVPFEDGIVLMSSGLEDLLSTPSDAIYTSLKWEEEKGRSGFVCLHQVLLMAALQARFEGAPSVSWRFALPDEMAAEGRESLMKLFLSICESVLRKSGYPVPQSLPVSFASESSALGAYFRYCASDDTRGGFMVLDLGACTADISLFMRGREQAVRTCQIPLGIHYMLLPSLLRDPDLLTADFGFCTDEAFRKDLILLTRVLTSARSDAVALRRARVALDYFLADHLPLLLSLSQNLSAAGRPSRSGALLLLHFSYLLMLSGLVLLQLASDPSKNDFLPEQMALCLSGRGAALVEAVPPQQKASLWHFLSMFRNRRVASLSLLFSAEKKMEIPVGLSLLQNVYGSLPPASVIPASIAIRPAELLPEFLLRFRREFPASAELLFPGFFTNDFYHPFTDLGESILSASVDQSFPPSDNYRPYDSLSAWIGNLLDLLRS